MKSDSTDTKQNLLTPAWVLPGSQAANCLPFLNSRASPIVAISASGDGTKARDFCQFPTNFVILMPALNLHLQFADLPYLAP